jgi:DNA-binding response OmpR family regulator
MTTLDSKRILIADADSELRTMLGLILAEEGSQVSHASNGKEAVTLHRNAPFDLVITELGLEGYEAFMEIRRHPSLTKFITTSDTNRLPLELCRRMSEHLGAHCFLAKPFSSEQLLAAVQSALKAA